MLVITYSTTAHTHARVCIHVCILIILLIMNGVVNCKEAVIIAFTSFIFFQTPLKFYGIICVNIGIGVFFPRSSRFKFWAVDPFYSKSFNKATWLTCNLSTSLQQQQIYNFFYCFVSLNCHKTWQWPIPPSPSLSALSSWYMTPLIPTVLPGCW